MKLVLCKCNENVAYVGSHRAWSNMNSDFICTNLSLFAFYAIMYKYIYPIYEPFYFRVSVAKKTYHAQVNQCRFLEMNV